MTESISIIARQLVPYNQALSLLLIGVCLPWFLRFCDVKIHWVVAVLFSLGLIVLSTVSQVRVLYIANYLVALGMMFCLYLVCAGLHWWMLISFARRPSFWPWLAFFFPILVMIVVKVMPLDMIYAAKIFRGGTPVLAVFFLGISYLAFRCSYLVLEVRNGLVETPSLAEYLFFAFFPATLAVGPISSYTLFSSNGDGRKPQLLNFSAWSRIVVGATKFIFLASLMNQLSYAGLILDGHPHSPFDLLLASICYYLFLYLNFSGYCDVAIGSAALSGVVISENFNNPLLARNIKDFWNRWHITLYAYIRNVLFTPLSKWLVRHLGPKRINLAIALSIVTVFVIIGLWHGFALNYILFGSIHALGVIANHYYTIFLKARLGKTRFAAYNKSKLIRSLGTLLTFGYVTFSLFFFANDMRAINRILAAVSW